MSFTEAQNTAANLYAQEEGPSTTAGPFYGAQPLGLQYTPTTYGHPCTRDVHYFECKHAAACTCGRTSRIPPAQLEVDRDL